MVTLNSRSLLINEIYERCFYLYPSVIMLAVAYRMFLYIARVLFERGLVVLSGTSTECEKRNTFVYLVRLQCKLTVFETNRDKCFIQSFYCVQYLDPSLVIYYTTIKNKLQTFICENLYAERNIKFLAY